MFGVPSLSMVRIEWHLHYIGMVIPTNWGAANFTHVLDAFSPLEFLVAEARNLIVNEVVTKGYEWLIFIDHDVLVPNNLLVTFNQYMLEKKYPLIGGLYFTKGVPAEPLVYRGRGNTYFTKWKIGQKVWTDGMGLGCHLIHSSLLKILWDESPEYEIQPGLKARRIFHSPFGIEKNPDNDTYSRTCGTEDFPFYERLIQDDVLGRAGWKEVAGKKYPFLCDTKIFCLHIDENGITYPSRGEERAFK